MATESLGSSMLSSPESLQSDRTEHSLAASTGTQRFAPNSHSTLHDVVRRGSGAECIRLVTPLASEGFLYTYRLKERVWAKIFSVLSSRAFASFGSRTVIVPPVRLSGEGRIAIGSGVFIGSDSWLQVIGDDSPDVALVVGDGSSIAGHAVLSAAASLTLGRKVLLARNVYISDHIHAYASTELAVLDQGLTRIQPVSIGDGAWLGQNVVVCPGVRIGSGAVIGANAVVTEDIPPHSLAVGAPARVVREFGGDTRDSDGSLANLL